MAFQRLDHDVLRAHKGKSFTGIAITFMCHDGQGRFFMTQRGPAARLSWPQLQAVMLLSIYNT